jgi:predicted chitinase
MNHVVHLALDCDADSFKCVHMIARVMVEGNGLTFLDSVLNFRHPRLTKTTQKLTQDGKNKQRHKASEGEP